ncbi:hypothetical protein B0H19DRAFT_1386194 [Mycena capillaripes]|nr:hypothetical protein B0H19DRAFT_1386194 [Mycena capillaripes]
MHIVPRRGSESRAGSAGAGGAESEIRVGAVGAVGGDLLSVAATPRSRMASLIARADGLAGCSSSRRRPSPASSHAGVDMYLILAYARSSTRSSPSPQHHCFSISVSSGYTPIGSTRLQRFVTVDTFDRHHHRDAGPWLLLAKRSHRPASACSDTASVISHDVPHACQTHRLTRSCCNPVASGSSATRPPVFLSSDACPPLNPLSNQEWNPLPHLVDPCLLRAYVVDSWPAAYRTAGVRWWYPASRAPAGYASYPSPPTCFILVPAAFRASLLLPLPLIHLPAICVFARRAHSPAPVSTPLARKSY